MRRESAIRVLLAAISLVSAAMLASGAASAAARRPVASVTIYPGDVIRETMLADADFPDAVSSSSYALNRTSLVGKMAKRTLLPGQAIPLNAIGEPRLVNIGAMVRLVYEEGGLTIVTYASALQSGAAGDIISVRNTESGITISGTIRPDGSIHVGSG